MKQQYICSTCIPIDELKTGRLVWFVGPARFLMHAGRTQLYDLLCAPEFKVKAGIVTINDDKDLRVIDEEGEVIWIASRPQYNTCLWGEISSIPRCLFDSFDDLLSELENSLQTVELDKREKVIADIKTAATKLESVLSKMNDIENGY